jgi:hypothetical protein
MAFRRDALLSIGGFNPVYLRAGDDVDVCWRLQAKGLEIGFAPAALVWHHHRTTVKAYWHQQVGYGEGETWLDAHHPEKFIGGQMLWRGRIYSQLPFVRAFTDQRINTGVWGTASFPSVYRTDVNALQFLPHSAAWMLASSLACVLGLLAFLTPFPPEALLLLTAGLAGWAVTAARCAIFAHRTDLSSLPGVSAPWTRLKYRAFIMWLHLVQPVARVYGRLRGMWSPPEVVAPQHTTRMPWRAPVPSMRDVGRAAVLGVGGSVERAFWSEGWTSQNGTLTELAGELRAARPAGLVDLDDGWHADRDLSVAVSRWGWLHVRTLVEEHANGRSLLRIGTRLQPSFNGVVEALGLALLLVGATSAAIALRWPSVSLASATIVAVAFARAAWQTTRVAAVLDPRLTRDGRADLTPVEVRPGSSLHASNSAPPHLLPPDSVALVFASAGLSGFSIGQDILAARRAAGARPKQEVPKAQGSRPKAQVGNRSHERDAAPALDAVVPAPLSSASGRHRRPDGGGSGAGIAGAVAAQGGGGQRVRRTAPAGPRRRPRILDHRLQRRRASRAGGRSGPAAPGRERSGADAPHAAAGQDGAADRLRPARGAWPTSKG